MKEGGKVIIYLSGPMTGIPDLNFPEFRRVAAKLYERGYEVINPADFEQPDKSWEACMRVDIVELMKADALALIGQPQCDWEPPRVATGIKNRTARLKALGNAVDPLQIFPIMIAIKLIDDWLREGRA